MPQKEKFGNEVLNALEQGKLRSSKNAVQEMQAAQEAATSYLRKDARINIRLSSPDVRLLKRRAAEEGIPYQTLIASVLHKFVTGRMNRAV